MRAKQKLTIAIILCTALAACTGSDIERAGLGGALGGVAMLALSGPIAAGALVGVGAGALCDDLGPC
ncbi:MAG: hypothetical protein AAGF88_06910 [Pseudomonadota bacterium]